MRLGAYPCVLSDGSVAQQVYGKTEISERHRHRYEVNSNWVDKPTDAGLVISGSSPDGKLVEMVEYLQISTVFCGLSVPSRV